MTDPKYKCYDRATVPRNTTHYTYILNAQAFSTNMSTFSYFPIGINQSPIDYFHRRRFFAQHFQWVRFLLVFSLAILVLLASIRYVRLRIRRRRTLHQLLQENPPMNFEIRHRIFTQTSMTTTTATLHITREQVLQYLPQMNYGKSFVYLPVIPPAMTSITSTKATTIDAIDTIDKEYSIPSTSVLHPSSHVLSNQQQSHTNNNNDVLVSTSTNAISHILYHSIRKEYQSQYSFVVFEDGCKHI